LFWYNPCDIKPARKLKIVENCFIEMNSNKKKRYLFYIFPPIVYASLIFIFSSISRYPEEIIFIFSFDKLLHLIEYYMFGYLLMRVFVTSPMMILARYPVIFTFLIGILYGLSDEWHQSFVSGRCSSLYDVIFDSFGVACAAFTYWSVRYKLPVVQSIEERIEQI